MIRFLVGIFTLVSLLLFVSVQSSSSLAYHKEQVLGTSEESENPTLPPTAEGPGLLLPDSPLFFLDLAKQQVRLLLAYTPEQKAKVHADVAGERMAELRFMLAKKNPGGILVALDGVVGHLGQAAKEISRAKFEGRDVSKLAKTINDSIRTKQEALDFVSEKARDELAARIDGTQEGLLAAKVEVEDALGPADLQNEIRYDLSRVTHRDVTLAVDSIARLEDDIDKLYNQASQAAAASLQRREQALLAAITAKNIKLQKERESQLALENSKQEKLLTLQKQAVDTAKKAITEAKKAAQSYEETKKLAEEIINQAPDVAGAATSSSKNIREENE